MRSSQMSLNLGKGNKLKKERFLFHCKWYFWNYVFLKPHQSWTYQKRKISVPLYVSFLYSIFFWNPIKINYTWFQRYSHFMTSVMLKTIEYKRKLNTVIVTYKNVLIHTHFAWSHHMHYVTWSREWVGCRK